MLPYIKSTFDFEKVGAPASPYCSRFSIELDGGRDAFVTS